MFEGRQMKKLAVTFIFLITFQSNCLCQEDPMFLIFLKEWEFSKTPTSTLFSPDGKMIATADSSVKIYLEPLNQTSPESNCFELTTSAVSKIFKIAFSPDGKYLAGGSTDGNIFIWDFSRINHSDQTTYKNIKILEGHSDYISSIQFCPNGNYLASGGADSTIIIWDVSTWKINNKLTTHHGIINDIKFSPGGTYLASCSSNDNFVIIWDVATWKESIKQYNDKPSPFYLLTFSPDGKVLAGVPESWLEKQTDDKEIKQTKPSIYFWDKYFSQNCYKTLHNLKTSTISGISFSLDKKYFFITDTYGQLVMYTISPWSEYMRDKFYETFVSSHSFDNCGNIAINSNNVICIINTDPPIKPILYNKKI